MEEKKLKAKIRLEVVELLHEYFMKSTDLEEMDLIEKVQRQILSLPL